jgi:tetratricopeptide (TPR) repeat protein
MNKVSKLSRYALSPLCILGVLLVCGTGIVRATVIGEPLLPIVPQASPGSGSPLVQIGLGAVAKGDLTGAEGAFRKAAAANPQDPAPLLGLALVAAHRSQPDAVKAQLTRAQEIAPKSPEVQTSWGRYYVWQHDFPKAESAYKAALLADPKAFVALNDLGDLYLNVMKRPGPAVETYRKAIALRPDSSGVRYGLAVALATSGDANAAEREFGMAATLAPADPRPLHSLGRLYMTRGEFAQAQDAFARALKISPAFIAARIDRGDAFAATHDFDSAIGQYQEALKLAPDSAAAHLKLGGAYQAQNHLAAAEAEYVKSIALDPQQAIAYNNLAWMAVERQKGLDDALIRAKKAVELSNGQPDFADTLAWVHRARGELDQASSVLERASAGGKASPLVYYHLGIVRSEQGRKKEALAAFQSALKLSDKFPEAADARQRIAALQRS